MSKLICGWVNDSSPVKLTGQTLKLHGDLNNVEELSPEARSAAVQLSGRIHEISFTVSSNSGDTSLVSDMSPKISFQRPLTVYYSGGPMTLISTGPMSVWCGVDEYVAIAAEGYYVIQMEPGEGPVDVYYESGSAINMMFGSELSMTSWPHELSSLSLSGPIAILPDTSPPTRVTFVGSYLGAGATNAISRWTKLSGVVDDMFRTATFMGMDLRTVDVSEVTSARGMFFAANCDGDIVMDRLHWDNLLDATEMFRRVSANELRLEMWRLPVLTTVDRQFTDVALVESLPDLSGWCVPEIQSAPESSDWYNYPSEKQPVWGTCPPQEP